VPNGGFESGSIAPWVVDLSPLPDLSNVTIVSPGSTSNYAVQLSSGYSANIAQSDIRVCPATNYSISFDYNVIAADSSCAINVQASHTKFHTMSFNVPSAAGDWSTGAFYYPVNTAHSFTLAVEVGCDLRDTSATVLFDNFAIKPLGSLDPPGCPRTLDITNGGFDSGALAPWVVESSSTGPTSYALVSPGYQSAYALQLTYPTTINGDWEITQPFHGLCVDYNYTVSFAVNWVDYTSPYHGPSDGCTLSVIPSNCVAAPNAVYFYPGTSGWQENSFTCSAMNNRPSTFIVGVSCVLDEGQPAIPAFSVLLDGFAMAATP
jgi:hypothetical protein